MDQSARTLAPLLSGYLFRTRTSMITMEKKYPMRWEREILSKLPKLERFTGICRNHRKYGRFISGFWDSAGDHQGHFQIFAAAGAGE